LRQRIRTCSTADRAIYKQRLFAIFSFSRAIRPWPKICSRKHGFACWSAAASTTAIQIPTRGYSPSRASGDRCPSRRKKNSSLEDLGGPEAAAPYDPRTKRAAPCCKIAVSRENEQSVQLSLLKIPAYYREVLLLRFTKNWASRKIATVMATPILP